MVDSVTSMHMVSKKDLNEAELESVRVSKNPTVVMTANGEVLAKEEATENVRELDLFVTVMLLENALAVLSLGKGRQNESWWADSMEWSHLSAKRHRSII